MIPRHEENCMCISDGHSDHSMGGWLTWVLGMFLTMMIMRLEDSLGR